MLGLDNCFCHPLALIVASPGTSGVHITPVLLTLGMDLQRNTTIRLLVHWVLVKNINLMGVSLEECIGASMSKGPTLVHSMLSFVCIVHMSVHTSQLVRPAQLVSRITCRYCHHVHLLSCSIPSSSLSKYVQQWDHATAMSTKGGIRGNNGTAETWDEWTTALHHLHIATLLTLALWCSTLTWLLYKHFKHNLHLILHVAMTTIKVERLSNTRNNFKAHPILIGNEMRLEILPSRNTTQWLYEHT